MIQKIKILFMAALLLTGLTGCGIIYYSRINQGTEISDKQISNIKPGMGKNDVLISLGEPTSVKPVGDNKVWFYCWERGSNMSVLWNTFGNNNAKSYCATVIFDKNGKVIKVGKGRAGHASVTPVFTVKQVKTEERAAKEDTSW